MAIDEEVSLFGKLNEENLEEVRTVFREQEPDMLEDLESLITMGKLETGEGGQPTG